VTRRGKKVLQDHKKRGSLLVAPFNAIVGSLGEVSWIKTMIPELLWIALIQRQHGHRRGVELITSFTRLVRTISKLPTPNAFASTSSYASLSVDEGEELKNELSKRDRLDPIRSSLHPLISWYPFAPLRILFESNVIGATREELLPLKDVVASLYPRDDIEPMMVQATAIWLGFDSGLIKVAEGLALAKFPEVENYPTTELSLKVGASIRASLNGLFGSGASGYSTSDWPFRFWDRGIEIEPCADGGASQE
jgi:hypothetical protein